MNAVQIQRYINTTVIHSAREHSIGVYQFELLIATYINIGQK